jgi:hypothetical protein
MLNENYFGVVDTLNMCLTELPPDSSCVALSYTWGRTKMFHTLLENISRLRKPQGMVLRELPKTIQDVIKLTKQRNERYL